MDFSKHSKNIEILAHSQPVLFVVDKSAGETLSLPEFETKDDKD